MIKTQNPLLKRLRNGIIAAGSEQAVNVVIQIVSVPLFLYSWGVELYGEWLLLYSLPSYLLVSDLGFSKAAVNSMTLSLAQNERVAANRYFHTCFMLIFALAVLVLCGVIIILNTFSSLNEWLNLKFIGPQEVSSIFIFLTLYVLLILMVELLRGVLSSSGSFSLAMGLVAIYRLLEFLVLVGVLLLGYGPVTAALGFVVVQCFSLTHLLIIIKNKFRWLKLGLHAAFFFSSKETFVKMMKPAFAFLLLPIGHAFRNQLPIFLIGVIYAPAAIVVFTTARTITNIGVQLIGIINKTITPEYAMAYGSGNMKLVKSIHNHSCNIAFWASILLAGFLLLFGKTILIIWTNGSIAYNYLIFLTFLISLIINSLWNTASYLSYSINRHVKQSMFYIFSTVISGILTYSFIKTLGLNASALGIVVSDLIMLVFVFSANKKILKEGTAKLLDGVLRFPLLSLKYKLPQ